MDRETALNQLGEWIEDWATLNDRNIGTVGSYRLASEVVRWLGGDNPDIAAAVDLQPGTLKEQTT